MLESQGLRSRSRRAKIVCTIGPASHTEAMIGDLMSLGMDVARLNFSHGTHAEHARVIERLRKVAKQQGRSICILQDLQGPKMRTGPLRGGMPVLLESGKHVVITTRHLAGTPERISTGFRELAQEVHPEDRILLSDGKLSLQVLEVKGDDVICQVVDGGLLGEHQGINLPGAVLSVPSLTKKDFADLKFGLEHGVDAVAISFVRSANDILIAKQAITKWGFNTPVCAKLEKPRAIENLEEILEIADFVMVARGDLGVEMAPEKVPIIQKQVIARAFEHRKPVITATQMLESMMQNPRPTRAEASDVANAILDGTDAVMLSGETAAGQYPREAVSMMARLVIETEKHMLELPIARLRHEPKQQLSISEAICESMAHVAEDLKLGAIAVYTESGITARLISKYRPSAEVYAFAHISAVCNRLNLLWGVHPIPIPSKQVRSVENMVAGAENLLRTAGLVKPGDVIGIAAGTQTTTGSTDSIRLHRVRNRLEKEKSGRSHRRPR